MTSNIEAAISVEKPYARLLDNLGAKAKVLHILVGSYVGLHRRMDTLV
jgi:hypothetical protein